MIYLRTVGVTSVLAHCTVIHSVYVTFGFPGTSNRRAAYCICEPIFLHRSRGGGG